MKAKELFNQQAISQTFGIGYDYYEAGGKLSINPPNRVSAKERGIPHVLKGVEKPLFKKSIVEPLNVTSIIIQEKMRTEYMVNNNVISDQCMSGSSVKVVPTTETNSDTQKSEHKDNMSVMHNMPKIDISHKACGVANCMSCVFNVMYIYFNSKHTFSDKTAPRQHMTVRSMLKLKLFPISN